MKGLSVVVLHICFVEWNPLNRYVTEAFTSSCIITQTIISYINKITCPVAERLDAITSPESVFACATCFMCICLCFHKFFAIVISIDIAYLQKS